MSEDWFALAVDICRPSGVVPERRIDPKIVTTFVYPPIPLRQFDWSANLDGWEPGEPQGWGETEEAAIADLREQLEDARP